MRLPIISGQQAIKVFVKQGYLVQRQRGSHVMLVKEGTGRLTVPLHTELDRGTLRALIRAAGMTVEDFVRWL